MTDFKLKEEEIRILKDFLTFDYQYIEINYSSTLPFTAVPVLTGAGINNSVKVNLKFSNRKSHNGTRSICQLIQLSNANYNTKLIYLCFSLEIGPWTEIHWAEMF